MEDYEVERAEGDAGVGEVEDGLKENVSTYKRNPVGPGKERKIEHIHHLTKKEGPVNHRVYDIACSSGRNHCKPHENTSGNERRAVV